MNVTKTISTSIKNAVRFVKFLRMGKSDVQECRQIAPYGVDSAPIEGMAAIYAKTSEVGKPVIIGYVNKNQIAEAGEYRTFSTDSDGGVQFYIHLKNDGTAEIGGDTDNMVRYSELKIGFDKLKADFNAHIHTGNMGAPTTPPTLPSTADISNSKINEIKTL